jgi:hypothetical protein
MQQGVVDLRNKRYGTSPSSGLTSLRLDVGRADHLGPFLGFVGDELAKDRLAARPVESAHSTQAVIHAPQQRYRDFQAAAVT